MRRAEGAGSGTCGGASSAVGVAHFDDESDVSEYELGTGASCIDGDWKGIHSILGDVIAK